MRWVGHVKHMDENRNGNSKSVHYLSVIEVYWTNPSVVFLVSL
jgi:hypothetical protein